MVASTVALCRAQASEFSQFSGTKFFVFENLEDLRDKTSLGKLGVPNMKAFYAHLDKWQGCGAGNSAKQMCPNMSEEWKSSNCEERWLLCEHQVSSLPLWSASLLWGFHTGLETLWVITISLSLNNHRHPFQVMGIFVLYLKYSSFPNFMQFPTLTSRTAHFGHSPDYNVPVFKPSTPFNDYWCHHSEGSIFRGTSYSTTPSSN